MLSRAATGLRGSASVLRRNYAKSSFLRSSTPGKASEKTPSSLAPKSSKSSISVSSVFLAYGCLELVAFVATEYTTGAEDSTIKNIVDSYLEVYNKVSLFHSYDKYFKTQFPTTPAKPVTPQPPSDAANSKPVAATPAVEPTPSSAVVEEAKPAPSSHSEPVHEVVSKAEPGHQPAAVHAETIVEHKTEYSPEVIAPLADKHETKDVSHVASESSSHVEAVPTEVIHVEVNNGHTQAESTSLPADISVETDKVEAGNIAVYSDARADAIKEHVAYSSSLRHEIESSMLTDINDLDTAALRARATKLASELLARAGWEGVRLFEASKHVEADLNKKFTNMLESQRVELEHKSKMEIINREKEIIELLASQTEELVLKLQGQLHESLRKQFEVLNAKLDGELKAQAEQLDLEENLEILYQMAALRQQHALELIKTQDSLMSYSDSVLALSKSSSALTNATNEIRDLHRKCAAIYSVESALNSSAHPSRDIALTIDNLREADLPNQYSELLAAIVNSLPESNIANPVPTLIDLRNRFKTVREEVRKIALAPKDAPNIVGQFVGTTLAAFSKPPEGLVPGSGLEETLSRVAYYLDNGKLYEATAEVNSIEGALERKIVEDWSFAAVNRLKVDVALASLKALSLLIAQSSKEK